MGSQYRERIYYKDRVGVTRGPASHQDLRLAYASGLIDRDTFVWAGEMDEWVPLACVYGLDGLVVTPMCKCCTLHVRMHSLSCFEVKVLAALVPVEVF